MKLLALTLVASFGLAAGNLAHAQEALAKSAGCLNCHAVDTKKVGPAFKDVAAKFKGKADAEATLVADYGRQGHPAVKASADDVKSLVKWMGNVAVHKSQSNIEPALRRLFFLASNGGHTSPPRCPAQLRHGTTSGLDRMVFKLGATYLSGQACGCRSDRRRAQS